MRGNYGLLWGGSRPNRFVTPRCSGGGHGIRGHSYLRGTTAHPVELAGETGSTSVSPLARPLREVVECSQGAKAQTCV